MLAGVVNVLLNLAFVVWFSMGVAGVAAAPKAVAMAVCTISFNSLSCPAP